MAKLAQNQQYCLFSVAELQKTAVFWSSAEKLFIFFRRKIQTVSDISRPEYLTVDDGASESDLIGIFEVIAEAETARER